MPKFLALTSKGLGSVLKRELEQKGFKVLKEASSSVEFEGPWSECYRANFVLRTATRVVLPVLNFSAYNYQDLYHNLFKKHDFTKYIDVDQTLAIDASTSDPALKDQRMVAMKAKDAIVDQFRKKWDRRPSVDTKEPDLNVVIKVARSQVSVSIDTTGRPLSFRGYRQEQGEAPLREHVAAALIYWTGWQGEVPLVDPMCGSGTLLIEAALMQQKRPAQEIGRHFNFQKLKIFQTDAFEKVKTQVFKDEDSRSKLKLFGFDKNRSVIEVAKRNARRAGVEQLITFEHRDLSDLRLPPEPGCIVVNPPYGERLEDLDRAKDLYLDLGYKLKEQAGGWDFWILSGHTELTRNLKMKAEQKYPLMNGPIECRWVHYKILPPKSSS